MNIIAIMCIHNWQFINILISDPILLWLCSPATFTVKLPQKCSNVIGQLSGVNS